MFNLSETNKYNLFTQGVDMRKGVESLCGIVRSNNMNPLKRGCICVFQQVTLLAENAPLGTWGGVVYNKRFEQGRLSNSIFRQKDLAFASLRWDELVLLIEGIRLGAKKAEKI